MTSPPLPASPLSQGELNDPAPHVAKNAAWPVDTPAIPMPPAGFFVHGPTARDFDEPFTREYLAAEQEPDPERRYVLLNDLANSLPSEAIGPAFAWFHALYEQGLLTEDGIGHLSFRYGMLHGPEAIAHHQELGLPIHNALIGWSWQAPESALDYTLQHIEDTPELDFESTLAWATEVHPHRTWEWMTAHLDNTADAASHRSWVHHWVNAAQATRPPQELLDYLASQPPHALAEQATLSLFEDWLNRKPEAAQRWAQQWTDDAEIAPELAQMLSAHAARQNPLGTLQTFIQQPAEATSWSAPEQIAINSWHQSDPASAEAWIWEHHDRLLQEPVASVTLLRSLYPANPAFSWQLLQQAEPLTRDMLQPLIVEAWLQQDYQQARSALINHPMLRNDFQTALAESDSLEAFLNQIDRQMHGLP